MFESDIFHDITERLWEHQAEPWVDSVLIFLYSGWRISELLALTPDDVDLEAETMKGGTPLNPALMLPGETATVLTF